MIKMRYSHLLFIVLLLLLVSCKEKKADNIPTSSLNMSAVIAIYSDSTASTPPESDTYIKVKLTKIGSTSGRKLESGGSVKAYANGITYILDRIEMQLYIPYNYDWTYYYEKTIPNLAPQTEVRIEIDRPSKANASSTVTIPAQPIITSPIDGSSHYRSDNLYVTWVPDIYNDQMFITIWPCSPTISVHPITDSGAYTILSSVFEPYASVCNGDINIQRNRYGIIGSSLGRGSLRVRRSDRIDVTHLP